MAHLMQTVFVSWYVSSLLSVAKQTYRVKSALLFCLFVCLFVSAFITVGFCTQLLFVAFKNRRQRRQTKVVSRQLQLLPDITAFGGAKWIQKKAPQKKAPIPSSSSDTVEDLPSQATTPKTPKQKGKSSVTFGVLYDPQGPTHCVFKSLTWISNSFKCAKTRKASILLKDQPGVKMCDLVKVLDLVDSPVGVGWHDTTVVSVRTARYNMPYLLLRNEGELWHCVVVDYKFMEKAEETALQSLKMVASTAAASAAGPGPSEPPPDETLPATYRKVRLIHDKQVATARCSSSGGSSLYVRFDCFFIGWGPIIAGSVMGLMIFTYLAYDPSFYLQMLIQFVEMEDEFGCPVPNILSYCLQHITSWITAFPTLWRLYNALLYCWQLWRIRWMFRSYQRVFVQGTWRPFCLIPRQSKTRAGCNWILASTQYKTRVGPVCPRCHGAITEHSTANELACVGPLPDRLALFDGVGCLRATEGAITLGDTIAAFNIQTPGVLVNSRTHSWTKVGVISERDRAHLGILSANLYVSVPRLQPQPFCIPVWCHPDHHEVVLNAFRMATRTKVTSLNQVQTWLIPLMTPNKDGRSLSYDRVLELSITIMNGIVDVEAFGNHSTAGKSTGIGVAHDHPDAAHVDWGCNWCGLTPPRKFKWYHRVCPTCWLKIHSLPTTPWLRAFCSHLPVPPYVGPIADTAVPMLALDRANPKHRPQAEGTEIKVRLEVQPFKIQLGPWLVGLATSFKRPTRFVINQFNTVAGLKGRILCERPLESSPGLWRRLILNFVMDDWKPRYLDASTVGSTLDISFRDTYLADLTPNDHDIIQSHFGPYTPTAWVSHFIPRRKSAFAVAIRQWLHEGAASYSPGHPFTVVLKQEKGDAGCGSECTWPEQNPRDLLAPFDLHHLIVGRYTKAIFEDLCHKYGDITGPVVYAGHLKPHQIDDCINYRSDSTGYSYDGRIFLETDFSQFDSSFTEEILRTFEDVYVAIGVPDEVMQVIRGWRVPTLETRVGVSARGRAMNASGRDDTALLNALVNIIAQKHVASRRSADTDMIIMGDDALLLSTSDDLVNLTNYFAELGLVVKVKQNACCWFSVFLGRRPYPVAGRLYWGRTLGRALYKYAYCMDGSCNLQAWLLGLAQASLLSESHVPILSDHARLYERLLGRCGKVTPYVSESYNSWIRTTITPSYDITTLHMVSTVYQISMDQITQHLTLVAGIARLPYCVDDAVMLAITSLDEC